MQLKDKFFGFGIYGEKLSSLTNSELELAKAQPWVEFLSPEDLQSFKSNFTLIPFKNEILSSNVNYIVRMNLHAWRAYLFGPDFITKNKLYFQVTDFLMHSNKFVPVSLLRTKFEIDPKTMFYLCKKLKEKGIIIENKKVKDSEIKIGEIVDKTSVQTVVSPEPVACNVKDFIYFNNLRFIDQMKYHVNNSPNGIGSKELMQICGMKPKMALKHMQRLCALNPDSYKLVSSIDQKHTAFKVFSIETLNMRNQRKLDNMNKDVAQEPDLLLSSRDRQEALKILAQRHKHFRLTKDILAEISKMTGYPYEIDRKNIIKNSREAGLKVFNLPECHGFKYIIALPEYDESIISTYLKFSNEKPKDEVFFRLIKKNFIFGDNFVLKDNGYCDIVDVNRTIFLNFLIDCAPNNDLSSYFDFDYDLIGNMTVGTFYKIIKIRKPLLKAKCAFKLFSQGIPGLSGLEINSFYIEESDPKRISEGVFEAMKIIDELDLKSYITLLPEEFQESLRELSKPMKFIKKLEALKSKNLINLKIDEFNRISVNVLTNEKGEIEISQEFLNYNTRAKFVNLMRKSSEETFASEAKAVVGSNFNRNDQRLLNEAIKKFNKGPKEDKIIKKVDESLPECHRRVYLDIKKAIVFQLPVNFNTLAGHDHSDVLDTLEYMAKKELIMGFRSVSSIRNTVINSKFKAYLAEEKVEHLPSDLTYFKAVFPKVENIVSTAGSTDFEQILLKSKFFEDFELKLFFESFSDDFIIKDVDGFKFISMASVQDPFE